MTRARQEKQPASAPQPRTLADMLRALRHAAGYQSSRAFFNPAFRVF
jgi:hypothetical protein